MIYSLFKDINHGLRYLHNKNLIHRDLKPSNCLLTLEGNKLRCVVSDFGEVQPEDAVRSSTGSTGTVSYCAPEVLQRVLPGGPFGNFTYKSDIFSLGMILYFLCFSTLPYRNADVLNEDNEDLDRLREEICQWSGFDDSHRPRLDLPDKVYWLLARLLSLHPEQRPSSKEIFELMKKHNNWDTPSDDRRSSIGNVFDMPLVPNSSRGRTGSTSTIRQDTFNAEKGSTNRTSERDMLTSRAVTSSRDYGSTGVSSPESTGDDRSLVLSRRHPSVPLSGPSEQHHWHHNEEDGEGPAGGQQSIRNWGLFNKRNATSPDQTSAPYDDDLAVVPSDQAASLDSVLFTRPAVAQLMAFVLFLLKIFSITIPCSPQAAQPWIFYPLLIIAAVDFGLRSLSLHVLALVFHGLVVWFARGMGNLCVSPR
jgi:serine/threonine protein kinase